MKRTGKKNITIKQIFYKNIILCFFLFSDAKPQGYISADPYYLMKYELSQFNGERPLHSTSFRPFFTNSKNNISISLKNEVYLNNNAPNQENMDLRYIGKGIGRFTSILFSVSSKFISFNFEPYQIDHNYSSFEIIDRQRPFTFLNDAKKSNSVNQIGLRKADIYFHYNGLGVGFSKDNMWWGPGLQSSLSMTNNTEGFNHFMIGTIKEIRWKNIGVFTRYTFANLNKEKAWKATYFTSMTAQLTYYSDEIYTFGLSRNYLTGGLDIGVPWTSKDAQKIIFEDIFVKNLQKLDYTISGHDPWDQTISGWFELSLPKEKLKLYLEIGLNDNRFNLWDFFVHPDHAMATIVGLRKYGLLKREDLVFGVEYVNLIKGRHHIFRASPNWYERGQYDDFSYNNRRWAAHSGSDSDDLLIYFGFMNDKWTFIPAFNFERHGVVSYRPPEVKTEFRIDMRYNIDKYEIGLYYEQQFEAHLGFPNDQYFIDEVTGKRRTNTFILRLRKSIL